MANGYQQPGVNGHSAPMDRSDLAAMLTQRLDRLRPPEQHAAPPLPPTAGPATPVLPAADTVSADPGAVPLLADLPGDLPVGWDIIQDLQKKVSTQVSQRDPNNKMEKDDRRAYARAVTTEVVAAWASEYASENVPLAREEETRIANAVYDSIYRGGRLQSLLDEDGVEDVMVDGLRAMVEYYDKPRRVIEKIANSHEEVLAWVDRMASLSGHGDRSLDLSRPSTGFRLPDGSRVTASLLTSRPSVVIRKHRIQNQGIPELVQWGTLNPMLELFLRACVQAKMNILIVGGMGAGKTSLLRALGREIPEDERLVTLESDRELYLDEPGPMPGPPTFAFEARHSNGERDTAGEVTISDLFEVALRYNATRVIVGEVRSKEIKPMLDSMSGSGSGSMCTVHVRRPRGIINRLSQLCTGAGMSDTEAHHLIAAAVDVVVYLAYDWSDLKYGGHKHRYVSHILEVHDEVGESGRAITTELFAPAGKEVRAVYQQMPTFIDELEDHSRFTDQYGNTFGFNRAWLLDNPHGAWRAPLQKVGP
ncbi:CpaF family protein [Streptomyces sp. NBC_01465]|uniref:CpaF family protein n=1 Tax=Streptomyces sp. NBC_01465 TaxID=2903878 RepID=UPI002E3558F0|nr:ATPase, T2SS/T4P/T4SS family [Streptomyces sp. NBC_01465]